METHSPRLEAQIERVRDDMRREMHRIEEKVSAIENKVSANRLSAMEEVHRVERNWMTSWAVAASLLLIFAMLVGFKQMELRDAKVGDGSSGIERRLSRA